MYGSTENENEKEALPRSISAAEPRAVRCGSIVARFFDIDEYHLRGRTKGGVVRWRGSSTTSATVQQRE